MNSKEKVEFQVKTAMMIVSDKLLRDLVQAIHKATFKSRFWKSRQKRTKTLQDCRH